jgi:CelD/BcsL family acetyltransferase involved in cellulose biosynthesis
MMHIHQIDDVDQFDQLKTDWERVYVADPQAHIFLSWMWLRGWFDMTPYTWLVLAVRRDATSPYVAFFPLIIRSLQIFGFSPIRVLEMGGRPLASYTGFVCLPGYEEEALAAAADYVQHQLQWDRLHVENVRDLRLDTFLKWFSYEEFKIRHSSGMPSLFIPLPDNWDSYLQNFLSSKTRKNLRRSLRQIEGRNGFCITSTQTDTVDRDIEVLLSLWQQRWGPKPMAPWHRRLLHHSFENNCLFLNVLWNEEMPVAAQAGIVDRQKKTFYGYIICHDAKYAKLSPGNALVGHSIRYTVEHGVQVYDFLTGADKYKFSFGAKQHNTQSAIIARKGLRSALANCLVNLADQTSDSLRRILGKIKRTRVARKIYGWSSAQFRKAKR